MPFEYHETGISGLKLIEPEVFKDDRGHLVETYLKGDFKSAGINTEFIQDKITVSKPSVLRGIHYQAGEYSQAKLVSCMKGRVFDVVVDLRKYEDTFGNYRTFELSGLNRNMVFIPRGCAHGYVALGEETTVHYKIDNDYAPDMERGIRWDDSFLNIEWPIEEPILSSKDENLCDFNEIIEKGDAFKNRPRT
jgi:dTDP-4-dehydrorhamnose 3,5-epimerase